MDASAVGVRTGLNLAALFGIIAAPIIPNVADTILDALGVPEHRRSMNFGPGTDFSRLLDALPRGAAYVPPPVLFAKIEDAQVAEWTTRFGGG